MPLKTEVLISTPTSQPVTLGRSHRLHEPLRVCKAMMGTSGNASAYWPPRMCQTGANSLVVSEGGTLLVPGEVKSLTHGHSGGGI